MDQTTANGYVTMRALMIAYNRALKKKFIDRGRLNRALGIAMRAKTVKTEGSRWLTPGNERAEQSFTYYTCTCSDHAKKAADFCKHELAAMLLVRAVEIDKDLARRPKAVEIVLTEQHVVQAIDLAIQAHAGQKDRNGRPYIEHPLRVWERVKANGGTLVQQIAALLHDTVEDTYVTLQDIQTQFGQEVFEAVDALSRRENEMYVTSILRVQLNSNATVVKLQDLNDNLDPARMSKLHPDDQARLRPRYLQAVKTLSHLP